MNMHSTRLLQGALVREFASVEAMRAHAKAVKARLMGPVPKVAPPAEERVLLHKPDEPRRWALVDKAEAARIAAEAEAAAECEVRRAAALEFDAFTPRYKRIIRAVAKAYGFSAVDLLGPRRNADIVRARQHAMVAVYIECPHMSLPQIGRAFGGKNHTTILHAVRKFGAWPHRVWPAELLCLRPLFAETLRPQAEAWAGEGCA